MKKVLYRAGALLVLDLIAGIAYAAGPKMPTFFARHDYPGLFSYGVQVADTNGDKIPDLIPNFMGNIEVQLGNGDGTFRPGPKSKVASALYTLLTYDFNGDGKVDLELPNGSGVTVSFGNGDGTFQSGTVYPISDTNLIDSVLGDFNGDGTTDIAVAGSSGIWLLTGNKGGTFNSAVLAVPLPGALSIAVADFNLDSKPDLAVTVRVGETGNAVVLLGNGNGTFGAPTTLTGPKEPTTVVVGSLTKGGPPSIAVNSPTTGDVYLYFGNGKGGFAGPEAVVLPGTGGFNQGLAIGDLNGDGLPDLISVGGSVAYGEGAGVFTKPIAYPVVGGQATNVVLADLRNNGLTDIITGGYAAISVLLNATRGLMEDGIWTTVTGGAGCGAAADFNRDGKPDLAVNTPSGISILLGTGTYLPPYTAGTTIAQSGAGCLITADVNDDGIADLLVPMNGTVVTYLGNGSGGFTLKSTTSTPSGGYLAVGDFNHDGKLDFATSGNLLALGNGDGTFKTATAIVASPPLGGFSGIAAGDINKDGWTDLVLTSASANALVLLNNHMGGFTQVPTSFGGLTYQPVLTDLTGDGDLDLVVVDAASGYAGIYLGNGAGDFTFSQMLAGPFIDVAGNNLVADLNGDGIPDIGIMEGDTLEIYLGEGSATYATPFSIGTGPSPGSILVEDLHGQASGSGRPDIVAPDTSGGVMVLFNLTQ